MLTKLEIYGAIALVLMLAAGAAGLYERHEGRVEGRAEVQVKFDSFVNETKAAGLEAEQDKLAKEKENAEKVIAAITTRNDALARLQSAQAAASAARRAMSRNPAAPAGSNQVCFSSAAYNAAFQQFGPGLDRFIQSTSGFVVEGDGATIDAKTLIQAWPGKQ